MSAVFQDYELLFHKKIVPLHFLIWWIDTAWKLPDKLWLYWNWWKNYSIFCMSQLASNIHKIDNFNCINWATEMAVNCRPPVLCCLISWSHTKPQHSHLMSKIVIIKDTFLIQCRRWGQAKDYFQRLGFGHQWKTVHMTNSSLILFSQCIRKWFII